MSFDSFTVDADKINYWENDVMKAFTSCFGEYEGDIEKTKRLIDVCENELKQPKSWITEFAATTALSNLKAELDDM